MILIILSVNSSINNRVLPSKKVELEIKPGMNFYDLSVVLQKKGVVKSAFVLRHLASNRGIDRKLSPGKYVFKTGSDYEEVLEIINKGPVVRVIKVTIPEGFSNRQVASRVANLLKLDEKRFLDFINSGRPFFENHYSFLKNVPVDSLEGYLFPDTYYVKEGTSQEEIVALMIENFYNRARSIGLLGNSQNEKNLHQIVTLASIVEKEARLEEERPLIASVFYNRLKKGMKLQSCATVEYLFGFSKERLLNEDLKIDSPYNTYLYSGLPPGPICNPGLASLKAALNPASTNYLYFVLVDESGRHFFARTYEEFLKAKARKPDN
jgi:UPF0755 protein